MDCGSVDANASLRIVVDLVSQLDVFRRRRDTCGSQGCAPARFVLLTEVEPSYPECCSCTRPVAWIFTLESVQVDERLFFVTACELELGKVEQCVACPVGCWVLDDHASISTFSFRCVGGQ